MPHFNENRRIRFIGTEEHKKQYPILNELDPNKLYVVNKWWPQSGIFTLYEFPELIHDALERELELRPFPIIEGAWKFDK